MKKQSNKQGFTIIEVVLVLAIAGLIFLMVFVALPTLQRSQRDSQRRQDMSKLVTAITNWQANNSNSLPGVGSSSTANSDAAKLINEYLKGNEGEFSDPNAGPYTLTITSDIGEGTSAANPAITLYKKAHCNGEVAASADSDGTNSYAVVYSLENAGSVCIDNK